MPKPYIALDTELTPIADAIREQLGTTDKIKFSDFAEKILEIEGEGGGGVESGEFTPITTVSSFGTGTDLEEINGVVIVRTDESSWANQEPSLMLCVMSGGNSGSASFFGVSSRCNWGNAGTSYATSCPITLEDGILMLDATSNCWASTHSFIKGKTYKYYIF